MYVYVVWACVYTCVLGAHVGELLVGMLYGHVCMHASTCAGAHVGGLLVCVLYGHACIYDQTCVGTHVCV